MPLQYVIDVGRRCIFMYLHGTLTDWDLGTGAQKMWADPAFDPHYLRLVDGSGIRQMKAVTVLRAIAEDVRAKRVPKVALVAPLESVWQAFTDYSAELSNIPAHLFREVAAAAEWLHVRLPDVWPPEIALQAGAQ
jgi:hypothetical protein